MVKKTVGAQRRISPNCVGKKLTKNQKRISVLAVLGMTFIISILFAVLYFIFERAEFVSIIGVYSLRGFNSSETIIVFVYMFVIILFIPMLIIWGVYRHYRYADCADVDNDIETMGGI